MHTDVHACTTVTFLYTYTCTDIYSYIYIYIHVHIHVHMHMHKYIHTYKYVQYNRWTSMGAAHTNVRLSRRRVCLSTMGDKLSTRVCLGAACTPSPRPRVSWWRPDPRLGMTYIYIPSNIWHIHLYWDIYPPRHKWMHSAAELFHILAHKAVTRYVYIYMYIHMCIDIGIDIDIDINKYTYIFSYIYIYMYVSIYLYTYIYM